MLQLRYRTGQVRGLDGAGGDQRALRLIGVDIDETDMHAGKGLLAPHAGGVRNYTFTVGQMAAVPAGKRTENLDILNRVLVGVAERQCDQGYRPEPAPSPGLGRNLESIDRRGLTGRDRLLRWDLRIEGGGSVLRPFRAGRVLPPPVGAHPHAAVRA